MKAFILIIALVFAGTTGFSQLVQQNVTANSLKTIQLDNGETKYLQFQKKGNVLTLLNADQSVWKAVSLPLPKGHFLNEVKSVSVNVFNKDPLVEILYTSVVYNYAYSFENSSNGEEFISDNLSIVNENGDVLLLEENVDNYAIIDSSTSKNLQINKVVGTGVHKKQQSVLYAIR